MGAVIWEIIKVFLPPTLIFTIYTFFRNNRISIIKEAPRIFVKQITNVEEFKNLNQGFKSDDIYLFEFYSIRNEETKIENISTEIKKIDIKNLNIEKNMLYININNKYMYGAEIKILDYTGRYVVLSEWKYSNICENQSVGLFIDFYRRPRKIFAIYKGNRLEYDIYSSNGAVKGKLKKDRKILKYK